MQVIIQVAVLIRIHFSVNIKYWKNYEFHFVVYFLGLIT